MNPETQAMIDFLLMRGLILTSILVVVRLVYLELIKKKEEKEQE